MTAWPNGSPYGTPDLNASATANLREPAMMTSMYNQNGAAAFNQFSNPQYQQQLSNGNPGSQTPTFPSQAYQVNPVVPAKRSRPADDGIAASPRPPHGNIAAAQSQTPLQHGAYPGYPVNQQGGQGFQAPTPYQHLQHATSATATPSPTMQNQQFRQPAQQRMHTASPNNALHGQQGFGSHMPTPQPGQNQGGGMPQQTQNQSYPSSIPMDQGYGQNMGTPGMTSAGLPSSIPQQQVPFPPNLQQQRDLLHRQYAQRLQQQQQQRMQAANLTAQHQQSGAGLNHAAPQPGQYPGQQAPNGQRSGQQTQAQNAQAREALVGQVARFMLQHNKPFNSTPVVCGRGVDVYSLFVYVIKSGGSQRITVNSQWPGLAEKMGWPAAQYPSAAQELKAVWDANLAPYERYRQTMQAQAQQRSVMAQQQVQQLAGLANRQQASPTRLMTPQGQDGSMTAHAQSMQYSQRPQPQPQQVQHQVYPDQNMPPIRGAPPTMANGYANPQPDPQSMAQQSDLMHHRKTSGVRRTESTPSRQLQTAAPSPSPVLRDKISTPAMSSIATADIKTETAVGEEGMRDLQEDEYVPQARKIDSFGGYDIHDMLAHNGAELARSIPNVPHPEEMGLIDLRAISLSLQSGIHGEVRLALDSLAQISHEHKIELEHCEDLIDALVDCAEDQIDALAEEAPEVSDALDLPSYEDIVRAWRSESEDLQNVPAVGSIEYDLDRAVDRLIAITTILRNVSFYESNHALLTSPPVIKVLSLAIRHLGTRNLLLRTSLNTADFYKDVVVYLSNTAQAIELPSRDDALHILHFLLAFAPQPFPVLPPSSTHDAPPLRFTSYHPITHRYLPAAVDSLAKLLARSDPNRSLYRHIFSATPASHGAA
ncbi:hypothetical protein LTR66_014831, partial [Elasticomyces elasticus]